MAWTQDRIKEVYAQVQKLAASDKEFRAALLKDAGAAIEKLAGEALPQNYTIKFIETDPAYSATFVIPPEDSEELSDRDLESIAGGITGDGTSCPELAAK